MTPKTPSDDLEQATVTDDQTHPPAFAADEDQDQCTPGATPEHHKLTGAELEARFNDWATARHARLTARAAARSPESRGQAARRHVAVALTLALAATAVLSAVSSTAYQRHSAAYASRIDALQNQSPGTAAAPSSTDNPVDAKAVAALNARASQTARTVAEKQQEYAVLVHATNDAPNAGNGTPNDATLKTISHRRALARYWDPTSFVAEESLAYAFTTTPYFDRDEMDPRFPWYIRYDRLKASDPQSYSWKVESVMPTLGAPSTARVVWVNSDTDGTVLAWASATYTDATRMFRGLALVVTAAGGRHQFETDAAKAAKVPELRERKGQTP